MMSKSNASQVPLRKIEVDGQVYVHWATLLQELIQEERATEKQLKFNLDLQNVSRVAYHNGLRAARRLVEDMVTVRVQQGRLL